MFLKDFHIGDAIGIQYHNSRMGFVAGKLIWYQGLRIKDGSCHYPSIEPRVISVQEEELVA